MTERIAVLVMMILMLAVFRVAAEDGGQEMFLPEDPLSGQQLFIEKQCIRCHSVQGVGGHTGPDLGGIQLGDFSSIGAGLWNHFPKMREHFVKAKLTWPELDGDEAQELFTFIYFLNFFDKLGNPEMGARIFLEKGCIRCHSVGGQGGDIGPELDEYQLRYAAPYITAALWNKGPEMMASMKKHGIPRPLFQKGDVGDILAFIRQAGWGKETTREYLPLGNPENGYQLFQEKRCPACHAIRGEGGTVGPDLGKIPLKESLSMILSRMWNHGADMWPAMKKEGIRFPEFEPEEMSDLITFLYFLNFWGTEGSAEKGREVFSRKRCQGCHESADPNVEPVGPDLAEAGLDSPFRIIAEMWNHAPKIEEVMKRENIRWPLLEPGEMNDLAAYLMSME